MEESMTQEKLGQESMEPENIEQESMEQKGMKEDASRQIEADDLAGLVREALVIPAGDLRSYSPLTLAFLGDAVYELIVRTMVVARHNASPNRLNRERSALSRASAQAQMIRDLSDRLTQEEAAIYRRGRNAHSVTKAKNATVADYRAATGFEALMGYLYLKGDIRRVIELVREGLAAQKEQRNLQHKETRREEQEEQGK